MKSTIVPAQITSVEDRIAGNLSFKQLILFMTPVFTGTAIFAFLPPFTAFHMYKLTIASVIAFICIVLAVRVRGRLIVEWITVLSRYNTRPRHYVFRKNDLFLRPKPVELEEEVKTVELGQEQESIPAPANLKPIESFGLQELIHDPSADFHFSVSRKGGLRVRFKEVK